MRRYRHYNKTNTCDECKIEKLVPGNSRREYDNVGDWTGRWLCEKCSNKHRQKLPNSQHNMIKSLANRRTNNLDPNSNSGKGDMFEQITYEWRGVKILSRELDNYRLPYDHTRDPELGIIQTKGALYNCIDRWQFGAENEHGKEFDYLIAYCMDNDMKNIERIYIFPRDEVTKRKSITIYKNPSKGEWYENYRLDDKIVKLVDNIYQEIIGR